MFLINLEKLEFLIFLKKFVEHSNIWGIAIGICNEREIKLLSYFMDMSDAEIAREMNLVRSTIHEHRKRSLEQMKKILEGTIDGRKESSEKS